ncbi:MAG: family 1 glycosylhydrolase, partial [Candidatus Omnitrophica bacterium]|nr:family 1 glycosylhydrolase [Candidatus Omnitrophota bacterium]
IKHYKCVIKELRKRGLEPIVTLHHFTNPVWFSRSGGWLNKKNIDKFVEYALLMVRELNADVTWWIVFNEPMVFLYNGFIEGIWPPGIKSLKSANKALDNVLAAYKIIYNEIKNIYRKIHKNSMVSVAKHMVIFKPCERGVKWLNAVSAGLRDKLFNYYFLDKIIEDNCLDYVAINYYRQQFITFKGFLGAECEGGKHHMVRKNAMGWYVYPHGLYEIISEIKRYNLPIMITENGTAEEDQQYYIETLLEHMRALAMAVSEGADVRGYMYWSLLDNFEWDKGFSKRFGLIKVNYNDMKRTIRESGKIYSSICADNKICL